MQDLGSGVWDLGFGVWVSGFRVRGSKYQNSRLCVADSLMTLWGQPCSIQVLGPLGCVWL